MLPENGNSFKYREIINRYLSKKICSILVLNPGTKNISGNVVKEELGSSNPLSYHECILS
jgi:hypothetical protein